MQTPNIFMNLWTSRCFHQDFFLSFPKIFSFFMHFLVFSSGFFNVTPPFFFFYNLMRFLAFPSSVLFYFLFFYVSPSTYWHFIILCTSWNFYSAFFFLCDTSIYLRFHALAGISINMLKILCTF